jgi:hypothetical protein
MSELKQGTVTVALPQAVTIPPEAGSLSRKDLRRMPMVRRGLGSACGHAASEMEKANGSFFVPGVDGETLRKQGEQVDTIKDVIRDVEVALIVLKQAETIIDTKTYEMLRRVRAQVKAQAAFDPSLNERFASVIDYFSVSKKSKPQTETQQTESQQTESQQQ